VIDSSEVLQSFSLVLQIAYILAGIYLTFDYALQVRKTHEPYRRFVIFLFLVNIPIDLHFWRLADTLLLIESTTAQFFSSVVVLIPLIVLLIKWEYVNHRPSNLFH